MSGPDERYERLVDRAIGERREALVHVASRRIVAVSLRRESWLGRRALLDDVFAARVTQVDLSRRGAFLDLGLNEEVGFLPVDQAGRAKALGGAFALQEGKLISVAIVREAARGKSPVVRLLGDTPERAAPGLIARRDPDDDLLRAPDLTMRAEIDRALEEALERRVALPGGGALSIEPTAALVAIDVDAGGRRGPGDGERFAYELNLRATSEIARQLRLRRLGGIVAVDFVSMRARDHQKKVVEAMIAALAEIPRSARTAPMSPFGVMELALAQLETPLHEILCDEDGRLTAESVALQALRHVEREGVAQRSARLVLRVSSEVASELEPDRWGWRAALADRIGPRFALETVAWFPRERLEVFAQ